jgi:hypothetical protein
MNPFEIGAQELTKFILSLLQPLLLPRSCPKNGHGRCIDNSLGEGLPLELLDMIESHLARSFVDPDPEPGRILPGSWWREAILKKKLLPWLWDLDANMIREKHSKQPRNWFGASGTWVEWDWELLARKLAQT